MQLAVQHCTRYRYEHAARSSIQYLRLQPRNGPGQRIDAWQLSLPGGSRPPIIEDGFGNLMQVLVLERAHREIAIEARGLVTLTDRFNGRRQDALDPRPFLRPTALTAPDGALARHHLGRQRDLAALCTLQQAILAAMPYTPGATEVWHSARDAWAIGSGVCQDHVHVMLGCARLMGLPARYVSGYLHSADDTHLASHAWAEIHLEGGWQLFDVTNGLTQPTHHVRLAIGMDYLDACPIRGIRRGGGAEVMAAGVRVQYAPTDQ
ncbi:transglutaminase-like putative cysteine protease [Kushneria sinocarnis]|uniref:Transglutaminase-like putative cysteine protease n=1 Tax=Kushneria sinocarnis TaxID=595502 RepID=A0A420WX02_9GAMM|nr:transglutaminase family protein [Kushneria sinocarnis]RKR04217.1 transglutaminase-like putative cysteine protease [Kushneria sinocarnis]